MYIRNKTGPKTDPCGTPAFIWLNFDAVFPINTLCCRFCKYDLNHSKAWESKL